LKIYENRDKILFIIRTIIIKKECPFCPICMGKVEFFIGGKTMKEQINQIKTNALEEIEKVQDLKNLNDLKVKYLGKKGELTAILRGMGALSAEERPVIGNLVNEAREQIESVIASKEEKFKNQEMQEKLEKESIDITLPASKIIRGSKHPINRVIEEIEDLFVSMGYDVVTGPELETDEFCFERLNLPKGHPARDMQDSFYITNEYLLRTQTSAVQARTMLANTEKTPIRMICAGKTYRREDDATHSHQFGQVEGLVIDKKERNVSLADLKGTLEVFVRKLLGEKSELRFRPSYFPFTEPSYEVDVSCFKCGGKGCSLCKQTGWIEILGAGIVHPNVLEMNGYDPKEYGGFAFGTGLDRLAMFKYNIPDMRFLYSNDVRFLKQFDRRDEE
jgi:phenylalanyl-tRNA synthetase alpha chain